MAIRTPQGELQDPHSPVRRIPGEPADESPTSGLALCLSGGGYRAMLFHLGALWRLNEVGYLPKLDRVSSVSGGSITAAVLGMNWSKLSFDGSGVGQSFVAAVVDPIRAMAGLTIDIPAVLMGAAQLGLRGSQTAYFYAKALFGDKTLQELPDRPRFVINATSMQSGVLWRFSKPYTWDYRVGQIPNPQIPLAVAVAASSAFPPFLSPVILDRKSSDFAAGTGKDLQFPPYTTRVILTDGGVYDNLGLETAWKRCRTILISDACGTSGSSPSPPINWFGQVYRVLMEIDSQVGALRKRQAVDGFRSGDRLGAYWGIASHIDDYGLADALPAPSPATSRLAGVATRLARMPTVTQEQLVNWGYAVADAALRQHVDQSLAPPTEFPYPASGVGA